MELFKKQESYLGVDIGSSGLKVVELTKKDLNPQLLTYGYVEEQTDIVKTGSLTGLAKTSALLKAVCEKAQVKTKKALAALPNFFVFNSIINLPRTKDQKELESAINWEAKKFIPMPLEEVVLDWKVIASEIKSDKDVLTNANKKIETSISATSPNSSAATPDNIKANNQTQEKEFLKEITNNLPSPSPHLKTKESPLISSPAVPKDLKDNSKDSRENLNILLTAAPKNLVKKYIDICQGAGLKLLSLETESFALARSLVDVNPRPVVIIDMGALISDIVIMEKGIPVLSRSVDVGGATITQAIMNVLNIDSGRAEQFKRDFGAPVNLGLNTLASPQTSSSFTPPTSGVPRAISQVLSSLVEEIRYSLDLYQNQTAKQVEKVILSGGSAFLSNFPNYLSRALSLPVYIGNPWDRVSYPQELKLVLENLAPRLAVAVGLALRELL